ncbi:hypothetical protein DID77_00435 [Candidatus Marinamargulisbacteria bacterium SCGC AG-439-L15]|nr:hypothetical protein DID77_00435 [Candidatus Marinamargulisbacteria bacterium SCGC AG-439-L15]
MKLDKTILDEVDIQNIISKVTNKSFWNAFFPELSIETPKKITPINGINNEQCKKQLQTDGYCGYYNTFNETETQLMAKCVQKLYTSGLLPIFLSLYDCFWERLFSIHPILQHLLAKDYWILPDIWAWYVDPKEGSAGWAPHRDKLVPVIRDDGNADSLTLWFSLSDATPENGCITVLPASLDPNYPNNPAMTIENFQDLRALPAEAGSVLIWNQAILHWGGKSSQWSNTPRISFACEIQQTDIPPFNEPCLEPGVFPSFSQRLQLIGKQILQYQHMYQLSTDYETVGKHLIQV